MRVGARQRLVLGWERAAIRKGPLPVMLLDGDGTVIYSNRPAVRALPGLSEDRCNTLRDLVETSQRVALEAWLDEVRASGPDRSVHIEALLSNEPGRVVELQATNFLSDRELRCIVVSVLDATERRRREEALYEAATRDALTGLANRRLLMERLEQSVAAGLGVGVLILDLDNFKNVNDQYGHLAGDELLRLLAERFAAVVPAGSTLGRIGGDEFTVVLPRASEGAASDAAEALLRVAREPIDTSAGTIDITASIGIAASTGTTWAHELLSQADAATYQAKARGKGQAVVYRPDLTFSSSVAESIGDLHRLRAEKAHLERLVGTDELTGIGNLRRYRERLSALETRAQQRGLPYSLLFCDVDNFGRFNKMHGQAAGDRVLRAVADAIGLQLRSGDEVHRRGGEELVVLLPSTDRDEALAVAERVREAVASTAVLIGDDEPVTVTISIGVGSFDPCSAQPALEVENAADEAMRRAKAAGRNRIAS